MLRDFMKIYFLLSCFFITGCVSSNINSRINLADNIVFGSNFSEKLVRTDDFVLKVFYKIKSPDKPTTIYIEGDGLAWLSRSTPSGNPTPKNPVALRLAVNDDISENIIYIARPCQYVAIDKLNPCPRSYWTSKRFAPEVIKSFNQVIDKFKYDNGLSRFNLVGYSGGAAIAVILTAQRDDILTLRTVAGNVNVGFFNRFHNVSQMPQSLDPANYIYKIEDIPQIHFIGENDNIVPYNIFNSFKSRFRDSSCVASHVVLGASHGSGWDYNWSELLRLPINCKDF